MRTVTGCISTVKKKEPNNLGMLEKWGLRPLKGLEGSLDVFLDVAVLHHLSGEVP